MRLTEIIKVNGKEYVRIKGTKGVYANAERKGAPASNAIVRLAAYEEAEEQGRLVILPCKVGDTLFLAQVGRGEPFSLRVQGMSISASGNDVILHFGGFPITNAWGKEVGRTLFFTREEAEASLRGDTE